MPGPTSCASTAPTPSRPRSRPLVRDIRRVERRVGKPLAVMLDLPGVKVRIGRLEGGSLALEAGADASGSRPGVPAGSGVRRAGRARPGPGPARSSRGASRPGARSCSRTGSSCFARSGATRSRVRRARRGGRHRCASGVGIHVRGAEHRGEVLTTRDRVLAVAGVDAGVDALAVSFVRSAADLRALRRTLDGAGRRMPLLVSKLERREALASSRVDPRRVRRRDGGARRPRARVRPRGAARAPEAHPRRGARARPPRDRGDADARVDDDRRRARRVPRRPTSRTRSSTGPTR